MALMIKRNGLLAGKLRKAGEILDDEDAAKINEPVLAALIGSGHLEHTMGKGDRTILDRLVALEARIEALEGGEQPRTKRPYTRSNVA